MGVSLAWDFLSFYLIFLPRKTFYVETDFVLTINSFLLFVFRPVILSFYLIYIHRDDT